LAYLTILNFFARFLRGPGSSIRLLNEFKA
jgi:hypothetical protein